jgi:histidinol-phosphate/aromatic aminotransferase/cobyric acid decarboxylase-like protein/choline kinase
MGKRLGDLTKDKTKSMIEVNGVPLINRMLKQLDTRNFERIVIVIGYQGKRLKEYISSLRIHTPVIYVENTIYDQTNNIYSLFLAKEYLVEKETILLESDLIFEDVVLDKLIHHPFPNLALVAKFENWMDGTVVTLDEDDHIRHFIAPGNFSFKEIPSYYKTVNVYKFSKEFSSLYYVPFLTAYSTALGNNEYYEQVLRVITLLDKKELKVLRLNEDDFWYEIDDIQDLDIAESIFASHKDKLKKISSRYGGYWRYPSLLDFCYLVNPFFPNERLLAEIKSNFERLISEYPSGMKVNSLLAAKNFNIRQEYVVVGNGAAELIKSFMDILPGNAGILFPTFEEYPNRLDKEKIVPFYTDKNDFNYNADDIIKYFSNKDISTLLLVNPDNPSGNYIPHSDIVRICRWARERNIQLVVDESFVDFSEDESRNTLLQNSVLEQFGHLVVIKSISKSFGVPGLRLGILASSNTQMISYIKKDVAIWNINSFAEFFMQIYGKYESEYHTACKRFISERNSFYKELQQIEWLQIFPSQANFFLCKIKNKYSSEQLCEILLEHNILIKDCSGKSGFGIGDYIRIAIRNRKDNQFLLSVLKGL